MKQIIIDTNLLVLLVVGFVDRELISKHKRTKTFVSDDWDLLGLLLEKYSGVLVTPNTLTETYNLAAQIGDPHKSQILAALKNLTLASIEAYRESKDLVELPIFFKLGLTDAAILKIAKEGLPLMTVDFDLYIEAQLQGLEAYNFNHLRQQYLYTG